LIDRNLTPRCIAFCETAPRVRRSFFAACGPESFAFAKARRFFTSSFDHGRITLRVFFAIITPYGKNAIVPTLRVNRRKSRRRDLSSLVFLAPLLAACRPRPYLKIWPHSAPASGLGRVDLWYFQRRIRNQLATQNWGEAEWSMDIELLADASNPDRHACAGKSVNPVACRSHWRKRQTEFPLIPKGDTGLIPDVRIGIHRVDGDFQTIFGGTIPCWKSDSIWPYCRPLILFKYSDNPST
jgi:hypothetical protein